MAFRFTRLLLTACACLAAACSPASADSMRTVPVAREDVAVTGGLQTAVLAGGCFWGVEGVFERVRGVRSVVSGYAGGDRQSATYSRVSGGMTQHAEAVRIIYDPRQVSYATLLRVHFAVAHDPTQVDRQGPDRGRHYRSAIFPQNGEQSRVASAYIAQLTAARVFEGPIATKLKSGGFFAAEPYHQDFMRKNPAHPYIVAHDRPKLAALKRQFPSLYRA